MLRALDDIPKNPLFTNAAGELVPDPAVYTDWWNEASERKQKLAVGVRRYAAVQELTGKDRPAWSNFLDPATGGLLPTDELRAESADARRKRVAQVAAIIDRNRRQTAQVATFGFELQAKTPRKPATPVPAPAPAAPAPWKLQGVRRNPEADSDALANRLLADNLALGDTVTFTGKTGWGHVNGERLIVRRFEYSGGTVVIHATNAAGEPVVVEADDVTK